MKTTKFITIFKSVDLAKRKIPLIIQDSGPLVIKERFVEIGLNVIKNFLISLEMIEKKPYWIYEHKVALKGIYETVWRKYSPDFSGIVEYKVQPGDIVKKEQPLARIKNLFDKTIQIIKTQEESVIISYADQSVCFPGTELFFIAKRNDNAFKH